MSCANATSAWLCIIAADDEVGDADTPGDVGVRVAA
jgi:hypothetical protein